MLAALAEDRIHFLTLASGSSQLSVISAPEVLTPSSGIQGYLHVYTYMHINKNKSYKRAEHSEDIK